MKAKGTPDGFLSGYLPFRQKVAIVDAVENRETVFKAGKTRRRMKCPGVSCKVPRLAVLRPRCGPGAVQSAAPVEKKRLLLFNRVDDNLFLTITKAPEGLLSNLISQNLLEGETHYAPGRYSTETRL